MLKEEDSETIGRFYIDNVWGWIYQYSILYDAAKDNKDYLFDTSSGFFGKIVFILTVIGLFVLGFIFLKKYKE